MIDKRKTCQDCTHVEVCALCLPDPPICNGFQDRHHTIEVPCKVGDKVWCVWDRKLGVRAVQGTVTEIYFVDGMRMGIVVKGIARGEWGKRIFATREEAEAEIEQRRRSCNGQAHREPVPRHKSP